MYWFVIPARKGSRGLPFKNRKLFKYTANSIPPELSKFVIVSSDDVQVLHYAKKFKFKILNRDHNLSSDTASTRDVLMDVIEKFDIPPSDFIVLLYLTYPDRRWNDIQRAISFREKYDASSLLCKKEIEHTPYLFFFEEENNTGTKVIKHDLCRRQDYRKCFAMSHYVGIFNVGKLGSLDTNLWNRSTIFLPIDSWVDIDDSKDLENFIKKHE
jgi:CMP-N-acetylneuraminic acid synthetase